MEIIIRWIFFFFFFIGRELTTWPANNYLQISVAENSILLMRNRNYALVWKWRISSPSWQRSDLTHLVHQKNGDRMIKQWLNSVIAKYCDLSVSRRSIICLRRLRLRQTINLLATDKSRYFAQIRPIIVNCVCMRVISNNNYADVRCFNRLPFLYSLSPYQLMHFLTNFSFVKNV